MRTALLMQKVLWISCCSTLGVASVVERTSFDRLGLRWHKMFRINILLVHSAKALET